MWYNTITSRVNKINLEDEDMQGIRLQAHPNTKQKNMLMMKFDELLSDHNFGGTLFLEDKK
jgi:hypothetical protein